MENLLLEHRCHRCGLIDESKFVFANIHLKQICAGCGAYVKFYSIRKFPESKTIRRRIWNTAGGNIDVINQAKKEISFNNIKDWDCLAARVNYWNLYLQVRKITQNVTERKL